MVGLLRPEGLLRPLPAASSERNFSLLPLSLRAFLGSPLAARRSSSSLSPVISWKALDEPKDECDTASPSSEFWSSPSDTPLSEARESQGETPRLWRAISSQLAARLCPLPVRSHRSSVEQKTVVLDSSTDDERHEFLIHTVPLDPGAPTSSMRLGEW
jgi:hypothetical protein